MPEKTCVLCKNKFSLETNQHGLVFDDRFFVCEECCNITSEEDLINWTKTVMHTPSTGMPIALWLIHEQNKDKPMFSRKK
ncbi:MAG: hypothetical protein DRN08_01435 [Thermoplasmata archaeon]|nr:MAG: hypothetical protein DRN05_06105 [Thermoplasmata archaeon]RLF36379.1 MAG: hypothetical protein DRN08_01435 [Thermoplasmata archaeon]